jgi:hypothetical protein
MMVMLMLGFLHQALANLEEPTPARLLTFLHQQVCLIFDTEKIRDGADMIILEVQKAEPNLRWAGAGRPLWWITREGFYEAKGERASIGGYTPVGYNFSDKTLPIEEDMRWGCLGLVSILRLLSRMVGLLLPVGFTSPGMLCLLGLLV